MVHAIVLPANTGIEIVSTSVIVLLDKSTCPR